MDLTIPTDVSLNQGPNAEASKTQTDHTSRSTCASSVVNTSPRLNYSKSQLFSLKKNSGHLARNLHYILEHLEFSEAVVQEGVAETTTLEYSGPATVFRIFALSTHADSEGLAADPIFMDVTAEIP